MRLIATILALTLLAACGRVGPPRPPGPRDQVTFPRLYPFEPPAAVAPPATPQPAAAGR